MKLKNIVVSCKEYC